MGGYGVGLWCRGMAWVTGKYGGISDDGGCDMVRRWGVMVSGYGVVVWLG